MLRLLTLTLVLFLPFSAQAKLYKVVDDQGHITFTDTPPVLDAEEHQLGEINAVGNPTYNMEKLSLTIPFSEENGGMIVRGTVNGVSMRFIVDTGATLVAIPPEVAKQAGLLDGPSTKVTVQTANGSIEAPRVTINTIEVAKVKQSQVAATIQEISPTDSRLGLLGMSFFNQYKMTINRTSKEIQLETK